MPMIPIPCKCELKFSMCNFCPICQLQTHILQHIFHLYWTPPSPNFPKGPHHILGTLRGRNKKGAVVKKTQLTRRGAERQRTWSRSGQEETFSELPAVYKEGLVYLHCLSLHESSLSCIFAARSWFSIFLRFLSQRQPIKQSNCSLKKRCICGTTRFPRKKRKKSIALFFLFGSFCLSACLHRQNNGVYFNSSEARRPGRRCGGGHNEQCSYGASSRSHARFKPRPWFFGAIDLGSRCRFASRFRRWRYHVVKRNVEAS